MKLAPVLFLLLFISPLIHAGVDPINSSLLRKIAIEGYDPVAYFIEGKPVEGKADFSFQWMDAKWYFSSQKNRELFIESPEKYAPQYGGYCAWAVSNGNTASIDPEAWKVVEGKLYLNYNLKIQSRWEKDAASNIEKADQHWPQLLAE
mgnify:CR=1 FL=1